MKQRIHFSLRLALFATIMALCVSSSAAPTEAEKQRADKLFEKGKELVKKEKYEEACPLFAESFGLDPAINAELHLADCYQNLEKFASAYLHFRAAADKCAIIGDEGRRKLAEDLANAIKNDVPKLDVRVIENGANMAGFFVKIDNQTIEMKHVSGSTPEPVFLDPGKHRVEWATAEGNEGAEEINVAIGGRRLVTIELRKKSPEPPEPAQEKRRLAAVIVGTVGVGGFVTAAVASAFVVENRDMAYSFCTDQKYYYCTPMDRKQGNPYLTKARAQADLATSMVTIGGVAAATAITLFVWPRKYRKDQSPRAFVMPSLDTANPGLTVFGSF